MLPGKLSDRPCLAIFLPLEVISAVGNFCKSSTFETIEYMSSVAHLRLPMLAGILTKLKDC